MSDTKTVVIIHDLNCDPIKKLSMTRTMIDNDHWPVVYRSAAKSALAIRDSLSMGKIIAELVK